MKTRKMLSGIAVLVGAVALLLTACTGFLNQPPVAVVKFGGDVTIQSESELKAHVGDWIKLDGSASRDPDPDGEIVRYVWDWGYGGIAGDSSDAVKFFCPEEGTYTVSLTVTDNEGADGSQEFVLEVLPQEQQVVDLYSPEVGLYIYATDADGEPITGTTPIFGGQTTHHVVALMDLSRGSSCKLYVVAWDPDVLGALTAKMFAKSAIDWPDNCFASTQGISRVRVEILRPDGSRVIEDTDYLDFDIGEPRIKFVLNDLGQYDCHIEVWDGAGRHNDAQLFITAKSCPEC